MPRSNIELLTAMEDILKADIRTGEYTIVRLETPDSIPGIDACPLVSIWPRIKGRVHTRINPNAPYTLMPTFEIIMWEASMAGMDDAYSRLDAVEENVYAVILDNIRLGDKVSTSTVGDSAYDYVLYEETFFVNAVMPIIMEQFG